MLKHMKTPSALGVGIASIVLHVGTIPVHAEQQTSPANVGVVLSPVIINARRISEDMQKVPISVAVIEGDKVRNIPSSASNADIARQSPNISYVDMGGFYTNSMMIRGVGSISPLSADDSSVSLNIDEVPMSAYGLPPSTLDLERVEILRGPQGTLYGRNSQGGAINFITKKPVFNNEYSVRGEVGTKDWGLGELIANTVLIDNVLTSRMALQYSNRGGDIANKSIGGEDGQTQVGAARGTLLYQPDQDTTAQFTYDYESNNDKQPTTVLKQAYCYPCSGLNPRDDFKRENNGGTFRLEHNFDAFRLTTISAIHKLNIDTTQDNQDMLIYGAYMGFPPSMTNRRDQNVGGGFQKETSYLQEIRLSSLDEAEVKWTTGVNYYRSEYYALQDGSKTQNPPAFSGLQTGDLTTDSYAAFGEMTVPIVGDLKGLAGLRVTHEEKSVDYGFIGNGARGTVAAFSQDSSFKDTFVTGRTGLTYDWSQDLMTYVTVGRGAVAGDTLGIASIIRSANRKHNFPHRQAGLMKAVSSQACLTGGRRSTLLFSIMMSRKDTRYPIMRLCLNMKLSRLIISPMASRSRGERLLLMKSH
ncbi:iron complex outermembrane recepter protein [Bartonella choladocola]|uniref:Iron complex outermembrane recepter protein n=1 Tax=Bartonella choladocola TaxID=2750995 RepID=A0A1U9MI65_9HYPH|nr:iron complex outermembrane recepter protein [Bartonella choladocola]